jgi:phage head maturation protease
MYDRQHEAERFNKFHAPAGSAAGGQFAAASGSSSKDTRPAPTNAHPVGQGETGKRVSDLQERLNAGGFKPPLKVDGLVGPKTTAALRGGHPAAQHAPAKTAPVKAAQRTVMDGTWAQRVSDLKYGHGSALWKYWTSGEGFAKWSGAVHKWTTLRDLLLKAGVPAISADGLTTNIITAVMPGYMKQAHAAMEHKAGRADMAKQDVLDKPPAPAAQRQELFRAYPLEDYHIVRAGEGDSSGRVVEAYMAVFGESAEIYDHQGHYEEDIDRSAFNKRIADLERSRNGFATAKVFYNHGMTIHGTPSDRYSMPTAVCEGIRADTRGPITRSRYLDTPLGNEVLEMWRSGAITAQSFTGAIIRSSPELRRGQKHEPRNGQLPRVRRLELGLKEYGPTPFPAYAGAELVGVRMSPLGTFQAAGDDDEHDEQALPPDEEAAAGEPLTRADDGDEHSARYHQHALYVLRAKEAREKAGLVW